MHVVVHRRGLETGAWLKVSRRSDIHYDRMRDVLVDVAGRHDIELEATPRLARGLHERVAPDAEYRRAGHERRDPVAPEHTPETALRAAAGLVHHARGLKAEARALELTDPAQADRLRAAGLRLGEGRGLTPAVWGLPEPAPRTGEPAALRVRAERELEAFARRDAETLDVESPIERVRLMREIAALKADARPDLGRHGTDLDDYTIPDDSGRYDGLAGTGREAGLTAKMATDRIAGIAERHGVDGEATVARFSGGVPSRGLAADFQLAEMLERDASRVRDGLPVEAAEEALAVNLRLHEEIDAVHALVRAGRSPYADVSDRRAARREAERQRARDERTPRAVPSRAVAADDLEAGGPEDSRGHTPAANRLNAVTDEVRAKFARLDADADEIDDPAERMRVLRQIGDLKAATARHMRDPGDLRPFTEPDESGRYAGVPGDDIVSTEIREAADAVARDVAADYGLDPEATVARYSGPAPSRGLARQFAEAEARERAETRRLTGAEPERPVDRDAALAAMRGELRNVYDEACDIVRERHARVAAERDADRLSPEDRQPEADRQTEVDRQIEAYEQAHGITLSEESKQRVRDLDRGGDDSRDRQPQADRDAETERQIRDYEREHGIRFTDAARQAIRDRDRGDDGDRDDYDPF